LRSTGRRTLIALAVPKIQRWQSPVRKCGGVCTAHETANFRFDRRQPMARQFHKPRNEFRKTVRELSNCRSEVGHTDSDRVPHRRGEEQRGEISLARKQCYSVLATVEDQRARYFRRLARQRNCKSAAQTDRPVGVPKHLTTV